MVGQDATGGRRRRPKAENIDFRGNLLVNSRTIARTGSIFELYHSGREGLELPIGQFVELLVLLEAIATSRSLYYDGTVPTVARDRVKAVEEQIESRVGTRDLFDMAAIDDATMIDLCQDAVCQAAPLLRRRLRLFLDADCELPPELGDIRPLGSRIDDDVVEKFQDTVIHADPNPEQRAADAVGVMRENFNGSKCVAGLMALPQSRHDADPASNIWADARDAVTLTYRKGDTGRMRQLIPLFMNSFRANFLNGLAGTQSGAAFFSGPETERVLGQQVPMLASYFAKRLAEGQLAELDGEDGLKARMGADWAFPFLGLLVFMQAERREPYSVFTAALADRDEVRAKFLATSGPQKRFVQETTPKELSDFVNGKLERIAKTAHLRRQLHQGLNRIDTRYVQPFIRHYPTVRFGLQVGRRFISGFEFDVPEPLQVELPEMPDLAGEALTYARTRALMPGGHLHNATYMHSIEGRIGALAKDPDLGLAIREQVRDVFGLELAA